MLDSLGEIKIHNILTEYGLPFSEEYELPGLVGYYNVPLRFDFAVFKSNGELDFLIEFQGRQHYVPVAKFGGRRALNRQKENDVKKRRYCLRHDLNLVIIPYYDEDKLSYEYIMRAAGYMI